MKSHSNELKNKLKVLGKEIDSIVTYTDENEEQVILHEELYQASVITKGNILKSIMKELDLESSVDIPLNTVINYQLGVKVGNAYEYMDYGNYVIYKSDKNEDTNTYKLTCFDKMLYAMKKNEQLNILYPCTLKQYLTEIGNNMGLTVKNTNFQNQNATIPEELYYGLEYTYRDILDDIAEATGSIIVINEDDEIEVKYPSLTNDTIDEEYLKDINVQFGKKYGPINSIVLSRSAESDNVYLHDEDSIAQNGLCEIKIVNNQIMNGNDRSSYLAGIMAGIGGLSYYINDYKSPGLLYYDIGDLYNVAVKQQTYLCLMLNDEISVTNGLEEIVYTEMPDQSETDYSKADKTDMKINQTYLIVDKQNQTIESVISNVTEQNNKISQITQTVDELNSKISDIADLTISGETGYASLQLSGINLSEPIMLQIHPITDNISYLYPRQNLYPDNTQYMTPRTILFYNDTEDEPILYELPDDLLYYSQTVYDEFYLDYESQTCQITKKCVYNADGTVSATGTETIIPYTPYPTINLTDGNYTVSLPSYIYGYIFVRLMTQNMYTTQFTLKAEFNTAISQTNRQIDLLSSSKVGNDEIINRINISTEGVTIDANKISLAGKTIDLTGGSITITSDNFSVDKYGNMSCKNAELTGSLKSYSSTNNKLGVQIVNSHINFYDWHESGEWTGQLTSTYNYNTNRIGIALTCKEGSLLTLGSIPEGSTTISSFISIDTNNTSSTPWVKNTASGSIPFADGNIVVQNGFIKSWSFWRTFKDF